MKSGKIIKAISGFYYVESDNEIFECKARGSLRNQKVIPLVGDNVEFSVFDNSENIIEKIFDRKNELVRPPIANLDQLFIISSIVDPKINTEIIDNLIAIAEYKNIEPIIVFTKIDLADSFEMYKSIYEKAGFKVILCDNNIGTGAKNVKSLLSGKVSACTGNTGVGKSSLLNNIFPTLNLQTDETSKKLGRGKHTTRHCELFKTDGGYVADTPGFSSIDIQQYEIILKNDLPYCFREFRPYLDLCKFTSCSHINDKGCAIVEAVNNGSISKLRHDSYVSMYNNIKNIKEWELK